MLCKHYTPWREKSTILKVDECYDYIYSTGLCGCSNSPRIQSPCPWKGYGREEVNYHTNEYGTVDESNQEHLTALQKS